MTSSNNNERPLVSVVIPAYNHERWIGETLSSVLEQSLTDLEVIVIDDGSTDKTAALVAACDDSRLRFIVQENRGTSAAINRGLELSRGKYIAILNSDDLFCPDRLAHFSAYLESHPEYMMAFSRIQLIDPEGRILTEEEPECQWLRQAEIDFQEGGDLLLSLLRDNFLCTSSNFFFRRRLLNEIGLFRDLRYVNDLDFLLRALVRFKAYYCERELLAYRQHAGNTLKERDLELAKQVDFTLEVSLILAAALEEGWLVRQWEFPVLVSLLVNYYRLNLETVLLVMLYFRTHRQGFKSMQKMAGPDLTVLLENGRRRLQEQEFVEKLTVQTQEQHKYIGSLQEALNFHVTGIERLEEIKKALEHYKQNLITQLWERDQEIVRVKQLYRESSQQYEQLINSKRFRLLEALSGLRHGRRVNWQIRELLRIFLPSAWLEKIRGWRFRTKSPLSVTKVLVSGIGKKLGFWGVRLFAAHRYRQPDYGNRPLLTLVVDCDLSGDPLTGLYPSLKKQTWPEFAAVFLVSGGDHELARQLSAEIARDECSGWEVLVTEMNTSVGLFNQVLATAESKYIAILRSGDVLLPTFFEECLLLLEAVPPHFFIGINNPSPQSTDTTSNFAPAASFAENRFCTLIFPRQAGLDIEGYDESLSFVSAGWDFYARLLRADCVGRLLPARIAYGLLRQPEPVELSMPVPIAESETIINRHQQYLLKHERRLIRRARQYWRVSPALSNLLPEPGRERKRAFWLDLSRVSRLPEALFIRLMARTEDPRMPLIVTIDKRRQFFFRYNKKPGLQVYAPEEYHLLGRVDYFYSYLEKAYQLQPISIDEILQAPLTAFDQGRDKLRILYVAPWLITGGADTMTVDWFCRLEPSWSDKFLATTISRDHNWLPQIAGAAQGIYNLPELGCRDQSAMTEFLLEFIAVQKIDILHIMNSEIAFNALPQLKEKFPELKVVAQFHCFDYSPGGQPAGYAFTVPPRYDHLIDRYNLEYARLGEEIVQFYPYLERSKFKVIHGCVDATYYNPVGRLPRPEVAAFKHDTGLNLLFIGRLDRQKQPLRLITIAAALRCQGIAFVMHVIGDANLESQKKGFLENLREQGLESQVRFYGEQPLETLIDWYQIADILLLTSDWEGVPMVLYQAMAMAVVPVAADVGGCGELITPDCGYLITDRSNPEAYLNAVKKLQDDGRRQEMARAARQRILDHFSLVNLDREYRNLYEDIRP